MDRIDRALDGELTREALSAAERVELERLEAGLEGMRRELNGLEAPDVSASVVWRIRKLEPLPAWLPGPLAGTWLTLRRAAGWLWAPRPVALRPAFMLGAVVLLLVLPMAARELGSGAPAAGPEPLLVQFRLGAEGARQVELAGDFTEWRDRYQLDEIAPGVWSIVIPLEPGVYDYQFVIDGERWTVDPLAPAVADGFGGSNSRIAVMAADAERTT
ncbi:MAG TPA: glycogen-binding domain-containing protein [Longimicrobiales bacterium]|nr:glycogen-binding domain-containing protein [Longimicrobiales bacterium]